MAIENKSALDLKDLKLSEGTLGNAPFVTFLFLGQSHFERLYFEEIPPNTNPCRPHAADASRRDCDFAWFFAQLIHLL
jgi:hypothetical protein